MAETARRYLAVAAAQEQGAIAASDIDQRQRTVARTRQRLAAGASPESVVLTAEAALARAELDQARARQQFLAARQHLAALWGERDPDDAIAAADLQALPAIASFDTLTRWLQRTPELARFASAQRVREARLQLARSEASADLDWQVGLRRLADTGDVALIGSVSVPLGAARRAEPRIRAAQAELALLEIERESGELSLYSTLAEAHGRYLAAQGEVRRLDQDIIPRLSKAEAAAERSYRAGAAGYLEWAQLQSERTAAHRQQLDAALAGQRALIELQRLTGQSLLATRTDNQQDMQP
jgi:cobalt-zinc-cadmium efflux system outer membrane protein